MVNAEHRELLDQILALLETACGAGLEMLERYAGGDLSGTARLLEDLQAVSGAVRAAQEPLLPQLEYAYTREMLENIDDTLSNVQSSIQRGDSGRASMKMEFQLLPFLRCLREAFYFWGAVYPDGARMERYYRDEFAPHYQNFYAEAEDGTEVPRLSFVITGYNHLETTRQCVEQFLKVTDLEKLDAEVIFIDHGSADGTLAYFESLNLGKVVHFKQNVRMYMFAVLAQLCRGRYFCFISNDILVTRNWAEILLACLESDENIIAAVPVTPHIANLQALDLPDCGPEEFVAWAGGQNRSDPSRWDDRARLMPPVGMYRTAAVSRIGFADPYFYTMEFWDDDFSARARRAGYRQIVCHDAACYHFGSVTGKDAQKRENTLSNGRDLFRRKWGADAWGTGFCYDYTALQIFRQLPLSQKEVSMLALDCGMGDTPMQIRNELRHAKRGCQVRQLTSQPEHLPDIKPHSLEALARRDLAEGVENAFSGSRFSFAYIGRDIACYENWEQLLRAVSRKLVPGGWLLCSCENPYFAAMIHQLLQFGIPEGRTALLDPESLLGAAQRYFQQAQLVPLQGGISGVEEFAKAHYGTGPKLAQIVERLRVQRYYLVCQK